MPTEPRICDTEGCDQLATHSYMWEWGEGGVCCPVHQMLHQQRQEALARKCSFALISSTDPPMERSERVKLQAEVLVTQEELKEAQLRGLAMTRELELVRQQCGTLTVRDSSQKATIQEQTRELDRLRSELQTSELQAAEYLEELQRLRAFLPDVDDDDDDDRNVVGEPREDTQPGT